MLVTMSYGSRKMDLMLPEGNVGEVRTYVTDRGRNLQLDTSLQDLHNLQLPARSVTTIVISLGDATGIADMEHSPLNMEHAAYDLQGRKIDSSLFTPRSSLIIRDRRKVLVR